MFEGESDLPLVKLSLSTSLPIRYKTLLDVAVEKEIIIQVSEAIEIYKKIYKYVNSANDWQIQL